MEEKDYHKLRLRRQLCFPIYLAAKEVTLGYGPFLKEFNLTYTQYIVMLYFWERGESSMMDVSRALLLDPSTITPILMKLEKKGYLKRGHSKKDERALAVTVTKKGMELRDKVLDVPEKIGKCMNLSPEEAISLYNLLYKLILSIERNKNDHGDK